MKVAIGSDHGGFRLKTEVMEYLKGKGIACQDFGTYGEQGCDYPDVAVVVAEAVARGDYDSGILICGTGIGMSIAANKVPGIRAALCHDTFSARMSREHNNANILAMGQRVTGPGVALDVVEAWLGASFSSEERHRRRVNKIDAMDRRR